MALTSTNDSSSIFKDGKLKPGIYKIQNIYTETFLDIDVHSRDVSCRSATALGEGRGLWEIKPLGAGYSVQRVEPGKPAQFCVLLRGVGDGARPSLGVTPYPTAWRLAIVEDEEHRGFEYVRFHWETTDVAWDLKGGSANDGTKVILFKDAPPRRAWRIWKLLPAGVQGPSQSPSETLGSGSPPSYDGDATTRTQHAESERDDFGTIVTEVTTVTTRKRYRVEDT